MFERLRKFFKSKQKGQSVIVFAASAPILCAFMGMAMDFGWMYLNQSRLQNAADAAAIAGAKTLVGDETTPETPLSDYRYATLVANSDSGLITLKEGNVISSRSKNGKSSTGSLAGDIVAMKYAEKYNLQTWLGSDKTQLVTSDDIGRQYDSSGNLVSENIKFNSVLYGPNTEDYEALYYTVTLSTKVDHLFGTILEYFGIGQLPAVATSAVKISHAPIVHGPTLYDQMKKIETEKTYPFWESISRETKKSGSGLDANQRAIITSGASYQATTLYRTEAVDLNTYGVNGSSADSYTRSKHSSTEQINWDNLFIDFEPDAFVNLENVDYDLNELAYSKYGLSDTLGDSSYSDATFSDAKRYYRIHYPIRINSTYKVRNYAPYNKEPPDSLYIMIEQEVGIKTVTYSDGGTYTRGHNSNSVHQIIINNNVANTNENTHRPLVFFYEGPEVLSKEEANAANLDIYDGDDYVGVRPFLPVILNLNADFRGIVFAQNNPVIICGNGHKMEGFVVAREFRRLKTAADFQSEKDSSGKQKYVNFNYVQYNSSTGKYDTTSKNAYAEISTLKDVSSSPSSFTASSYDYKKSNQKYVKVQANINGTWIDAYVQDGQWYTSPATKSDKIQINYNGDKTKYSYRTMLLFPFTYNNKTYVATPDSKFYVKVTSERVIDYTKGSTSSTDTNWDYQSVPTMYVSGTSYNYEETYYNVKGETKKKTTRMAIGDVAWMPVTTISATISATSGRYTESPDDYTSFQDDDALRYDYVNTFNLKSSSVYNSFLNVGLVNYTYLSKYEASSTKTATQSHDMFFTTYRSQHID